ncbi:putative GPI-anchored protein [Capsicum galapagoense]
MASIPRYFFISLLVLHSLLFSFVKCDDEEDNLLKGINSYRASLNLKTLRENDKAKCLADEMADQFKDQPCTNTTGANTVPGTEPQFSNYPKLLSKCKLNVTTTRDGMIMPACVPNLVPDLVLSNFTKSQYSNYLNDTKFSGVGIGSDDNWMVVVLTTSNPEGSFTPDNSSANLVFQLGLISHAVFLLVAFLILL